MRSNHQPDGDRWTFLPQDYAANELTLEVNSPTMVSFQVAASDLEHSGLVHCFQHLKPEEGGLLGVGIAHCYSRANHQVVDHGRPRATKTRGCT